MNKIAQFEKVSYEEFYKDWLKTFPNETRDIAEIYNVIKYDFYTPIGLKIAPQETVLIPTGIRVKMADDYVLMLFPRSGLGFKYRLQMNNTVGIIDSDYYHADNEGHIFCKLTNDTNENKTVEIASGQGMLQGIFVSFGITVDDEVDAVRTGGFGSTTKQKDRQ